MTSSGIGISRSVETSCRIRSIGKSGARSSGPIGWPVPGCSGGCGGDGASARTLYQARGMSRSGSRILVSAMAVSSGEVASSRRVAADRLCLNRAPRATA